MEKPDDGWAHNTAALAGEFRRKTTPTPTPTPQAFSRTVPIPGHTRHGEPTASTAIIVGRNVWCSPPPRLYPFFPGKF